MEALKTSHRQEERQPNEDADCQHAQDRAQAEGKNIKGSHERGLDLAEDDEHQGAAARHAMSQADEQRFSHMRLVVFVGMSVRRLMGMKVDVHFVTMMVEMDVGPLFVIFPENLNPEEDENDADQKLCREGHPRGRRNPKKEEEKADNKKSGRMADAPDNADEQGPEEASALAYYGGDGHHVVGIKRVLHSQGQTESHRRKQGHSALSLLQGG